MDVGCFATDIDGVGITLDRPACEITGFNPRLLTWLFCPATVMLDLAGSGVPVMLPVMVKVRLFQTERDQAHSRLPARL